MEHAMTRCAKLILISLTIAALVLAPKALAQNHADGTIPTDTHAAADDAAHAGDTHREPHGVIPTAKQALVPALATIIVFGAVIFILGMFVWPKINAGLDERAGKILDEIASAEAARKQAAAALEQYQENLSEARAEAQKMLDNTKAQQSEIAADLRSKADAELSSMREKALRDIDSAKKAAINEIYADASNLATLMASKILKREVSPQDTQSLLQESLAELGSSNN